ncbi:unnamed protein product [Oikopleura dioica]|uniref:Reverse transcriptase domain-containing protein n=1 Tax=Oikopleura dioica TaxID=34765 RepID=E4WQA1_OIKDI|nr:unnamed protein product [Oikopleura dioica]
MPTKRKRKNLSPSPKLYSRTRRRLMNLDEQISSELTPPGTPVESESSRIVSAGPGNDTISSIGDLPEIIENTNIDFLDPNFTICTENHDEPVSSTLLESSLLQYDAAALEAEQEDEERFQVAFLPCDGTFYYTAFRNICPLEKPLVETIDNIVKDNLLDPKDKSKPTKLSKDEYLCRSALDDIASYLGSPLSVMDIILAPGCLVFSGLKIDSQEMLREWQAKSAKISIAIKDSVQSLSKGKDWLSKDMPQKATWLTCCHVLASHGTDVLGQLKTAGLEFVDRIANPDARNIEARHLLYTVNKLQELAYIYASARRLSELYLVDPKDLVHFIPTCNSLLLWTLIKEKTVQKFYPALLLTPLNQVPNMVERRLHELGVRIHSHGKSGRKVIGTASNFKCHPADRPLIGQTREVNYLLKSKNEIIKSMKLINSSILRYVNCEYDEIPKELNTPQRSAKKFLSSLIDAIMNKKSFLERFLTRNVSFGEHGEYTNRIFRLRSKESKSKLASRKPPAWSSNPANFVPRSLLNRVKIDISKYSARKLGKNLEIPKNTNSDEKPEKPRSNHNIQINPSSQPTAEKLPPSQISDNTELQEILDELQNLILENTDHSDPRYAKLCKRVKTLSVSENPESISLLKQICDNLNMIGIKKVAQSIIVMSVNAGRITDPERIRLLCAMFPKVSIFCYSEVMWPRKEVLRKGNWPQDFSLLTHSQLGTSLDSYSFIAYNNTVITKIRALPSVGTFTIAEIKDKKTTAILAVGYRFNDRNDSKRCWFTKYLKKDPEIFCDWVDEIIELYDKKKYKLFVTGDLNYEDVPRSHDPKKICTRLSKRLRLLVNIVTRPTHIRPGARDSSIDKVICNDPTNTKLKYLNLHQPPFNFDGHRGLCFQIPISPCHINYEVYISSHLNGRRDVFESSLKLEEEKNGKIGHNRESWDFKDHFDLLSEILHKNTSRIAKIKRPPSRNNFNYSSTTWRFINFTNDFKDKIRSIDKQILDSRIARRTSSILESKIKKLKKIDEMRYRNDTSHRLSKNKNVIWDMLSHITAPPPLDKITDNEDRLVERVKELQTNTIMEGETFIGPPIELICSKKLNSMPIVFNSTSKIMPSFYNEYLNLADITKGASGHSKTFFDGLPSHFIFDHLFKPISAAMNSGEFPLCLRLSRVTVLSKGGGAIRPISISEPIGSILEKLIMFFITPFLELNKLLPEAQSGFRTGLGCSTSLFQVVNGICRAYDRGKVVMAVAIDCRNAFGTVPHSSIIAMLGKICTGPVLRILSESLERSVRVHRNGFISKTLPLREFGIPQGGVIAPLIFSLYVAQVNSILDQLPESSRISIFADDQCILICGDSHQEVVSKAKVAVELLANVLKDMGMSLVSHKTIATVFGKFYADGIPDKTVNLMGSDIEFSYDFKYLGTTISSRKGRITFDKNIENLINKSQGIINRLRSLRPFIYERENAQLLRGTMQGLLNHSFEITPPFSRKDLNSLNTIFYTGLRNTRAPAWYYRHLQKESELDLSKSSKMAFLLSKFSIPTIYQTKVSLFAKSINKSIIARRSNILRNTLICALKLIDKKTQKSIIPFPDLLIHERRNEEILRMNALFQENLNTVKVPDDLKFFASFLRTCLTNNVIEVKLINHRNRNSLENQVSWPWAFGSEFNSLPVNVRNSVGTHNFDNNLINYLSKVHPHPEPSLECTKLCKIDSNEQNNSLPLILTQMPELTGEDSWAATGRLLKSRDSEIDKDSNIIHGLLASHYLESLENNDSLSLSLKNLCSTVLAGKTLSIVCLIHKLVKVTKSNEFFAASPSIYD